MAHIRILVSHLLCHRHRAPFCRRCLDCAQGDSRAGVHQVSTGGGEYCLLLVVPFVRMWLALLVLCDSTGLADLPSSMLIYSFTHSISLMASPFLSRPRPPFFFAQRCGTVVGGSFHVFMYTAGNTPVTSMLHAKVEKWLVSAA
jgi:hypothetical protein